MSEAETNSANYDETRRLNQTCPGAPTYFTFPVPLSFPEEEKQQYEEVGKKIDELVAGQLPGTRLKRSR